MPMLINFIWLIIEMIGLLNKKKDARGNILVEFQEKYPIADETQVKTSFKTFLLVSVFLGGLGFHDFYAGYLGRGFMHMGLFVVGLIFVIPYATESDYDRELFLFYVVGIIIALIHYIWIAIELSNTFKDKNGNIMIEFQNRS